MVEHPCNVIKDYTKKDICDFQFTRLEEKIAKLEKSVERLATMMWGQFSAVVFGIGTYVISKLIA